MDPVIWIEVLSRHRDVVARHRCPGPEVRIGRGYGNDVVIDDPYVAVDHLRIFRDPEGHLVAEDLGTVNGTFADQAVERSPWLSLDGDRLIHIGHTALRIRDASHALPAERTVEPTRRAWPLAAGMLAALIGVELLSAWLAQTTEPKPSQYLGLPLLVLLFLLVWTATWSILCRIFDGQAHVERNLLIATGGLLAFSLWNEFAWFFSYAFASRVLAQYQYVVQVLAIAGICFLHLRVMGPRRLWVKAGVVGLLAATAIALQALNVIEGSGRSVTQVAQRRLMPPDFRIAPMQTPDAFLADVAKLKAALDRDRGKAPDAPEEGEDDD